MTKTSFWRDPLIKNYLYAFFKHSAFFSAVLVPFFTDWGGLTLFQVQLIQSWFSFWVFFLEVPTGALADRLGRKYSLALGSLIVGLAVILYGSIPRFEIFLLSEFLFAVGYAFSSGADHALAYDKLKELGREKESTKVFGRLDAFQLFGMLIAAPLGSVIAARYGMNAPMIASSAPFILAAVIGLSISEPKIHSGSDKPRYLEIVKKGLSTIRRRSAVRTLAVDSVLVSAAAYFVIWFYQPMLTKLGVPIQYFGLVHAAILGIEILILNNFGLLEKFFGKGRDYLRASALLTTIGFVIVSAIPNLAATMVFILLVAGFGYTRSTYIVSLANKYIDSGERATVLSVIGMFRRFALILINPLIGSLADSSLRLALFTVGLLPLLTLLIKEKLDD